MRYLTVYSQLNRCKYSIAVESFSFRVQLHHVAVLLVFQQLSLYSIGLEQILTLYCVSGVFTSTLLVDEKRVSYADHERRTSVLKTEQK